MQPQLVRRHARKFLLATGLLGVAIEARAAQPCEVAARQIERQASIPSGLLQAIGQVESGRLLAGRITVWPWTANAAGSGHYFASKPQAIAWVRQAQSQGLTSIDVGCMQVNLQQHPHAFHTLDEAFDPVANTGYAAGFLKRLHGESGDWKQASGLYHSRTITLALPYMARVAAVNAVRPTAVEEEVAAAPPPREPSMSERLALSWKATLPDQAIKAKPGNWSLTPLPD